MQHPKLLTALVLLVGISISSGPLFAEEVPVIDATQEEDIHVTDLHSTASSVSSTTHETLEQKVARLEKQVTSRSEVDLLTQVEQLQQQIQELRGQLEVQSHDLKILQEQQRVQYQDLDQRLAKQPKQLTTTKQSTEVSEQKINTAVPQVADESVSIVNGTTDVDVMRATNDNHRTVVKATGDDVAYHTAYQALRDRKYEQAQTTLKKFLHDYPHSSYAVNAHYWLGEIALMQGRPDAAISEFTKVIQGNPSQTKLAEANLKLAFAYHDKAQWQKARDQFNKVKQQFSGTSSAQLATSRLKEMTQQGH